VDAAMNMGYKFTGSSSSQQEFEIQHRPKKIQLLNMFEFDSDRKRMSVIIKDSDGHYKLYIKGADNIIKGRLNTRIK
jgi:magnesium-transporting ATPase (P-type)